MAGPTFHIQCPACGQAFYSHVDHPQMAQACPQCHFNGLRGQFAPLAEPAAQRREPKRFAPTAASGPPPAWEVQQYGALNRAPVQPPFQPAAPAAPSPQMMPPAPGTADWAAVQAYQEMMTARQRAPLAPPPAPEYAPSSTPPLRAPPADWAPMKPSNLPKLSPWPGLEPATGNDETLEQWQAASRRRGFPWRWLLAALVVGGLITTLVIERKRANAVMSQLAIEARAASSQQPSSSSSATVAPLPEDGTIAKAIVVDETPRECTLSPAQSEAIARPLVERLFAATTEAERLACIAFPKRDAESVKDFFTRHPEVKLKTLSVVTKAVRCLPNPAPQPIFDISTSLSNESSGILRLVSGNDKEPKIDWLLLHDSLDGVFAAYQKKSKEDTVPQWITLGLHRNYGFGEPPDLRETNSFFDMQGYGNGFDKAVVQVVKNSSTGRAMDQALTWGDLFIVRVLIGWQAFNGVPRLTVINAELDATGAGS